MANRYSEMSMDDLLNEESQLRTSLFNLRVENATKELQNSSRIRQARKEIARVLTLIRIRQGEQAKAEAPQASAGQA